MASEPGGSGACGPHSASGKRRNYLRFRKLLHRAGLGGLLHVTTIRGASDLLPSACGVVPSGGAGNLLRQGDPLRVQAASPVQGTH